MENKAQKPDEIDLIKVFALLWEKRKLIAITTFVFALLGFIYAFVIATPMYKSTITLYPATQEEGSSSQLMQMASQFGLGGLTSSSNNYNIPDVVKSRRFCEKIVTNKWNVTLNDTIYSMNLRDFFNRIDKVKVPKKIKTIEGDKIQVYFFTH